MEMECLYLIVVELQKNYKGAGGGIPLITQLNGLALPPLPPNLKT